MVSKRLINYIREDLKSHDKEEIKKILVEQGYPEELADNAIKDAVEASEQEKGTKIKEEQKEKGNIKKLEEERESKKEQLNTKAEESKKKLKGLKKKTIENARKNSKVLILILIMIILGASFFVFKDFFDDMFYGIATKKSNKCDMISDYWERDNCYEKIALETKNADICYKIGDKDLRFHCIGVLNFDLSLCELIEEQGIKDWCYEDIALETENISICYKIQDNDLNLACVGIINFNSSSCELIEKQKVKNWCYERIAERKENN